jgi:hypothetical protein
MFKYLLSRLSRQKSLPSPLGDAYRLEQAVKGSAFIRLHFGCGPRVLKGWINIDLAYEPYENYLKYYGDMHYPSRIRGGREEFYALDVTKEPLPLPDNSVDVVFHEDFIEHLDQRGQILFLAETLRVLKKGGIHRVNTPDLITSMLTNSNFKLGNAGVHTQEWDKHVHKCVLTKDMLREVALLVGYSEVVFTQRNGSSAQGLPLEYRPDPHDRAENGNIFADLIK